MICATISIVSLCVLGGWVAWLGHRERMLKISLHLPVDYDDE